MLKADSIPSKLDYQPLDITGKAIVISGGTTGIGRATAVMLASHGARLVIYGRHREQLDDALADLKDVGGEVYGLTADQSVETDVRRVFELADEKLGGLDILINNAALAGETVATGEYADWKYIVETNLLGYMACCREALDRMRPNGAGHIVNVGSMSADVREVGSDVYVATKGAIQAFSESLRKQVNKDGVKVSLIEPGSVGTNLSGDEPGIEKKQEKSIKKEEMLRAEDIAASIYYCITQPPRCDVVNIQIRPHKQMI